MNGKRRITMLATVCALAVMMSGVVKADPNAAAEVQVYATVNPNITMTPGASVSLGTIQTGSVTGKVSFDVHANVQEVDFYVLATCLYKGDDPTSVHVIPVAGNGCLVEPQFGNATAPADNDLVWTTKPSAVANGDGTVTVTGGEDYGNGMRAAKSEQQEFESGQSNRFSQTVDVTVDWEQIEDELPTGTYSGFVKLVGLVS